MLLQLLSICSSTATRLVASRFAHDHQASVALNPFIDCDLFAGDDIGMVGPASVALDLFIDCDSDLASPVAAFVNTSVALDPFIDCDNRQPCGERLCNVYTSVALNPFIDCDLLNRLRQSARPNTSVALNPFIDCDGSPKTVRHYA